jgi:uncharacterized protein
MAEPAVEVVSAWKKRWRAWLRAIHRDVGYLAVGFTIIYALSGIAMNHIDDWDPSFTAENRTLVIEPVSDELDDDEAAAVVAKAAGLEAPASVYRAGDEVRLEYENGTKVTAIGEQVTVQARSDRFFFRAAVWLHATRGKQAWKYISDVYAVLLLYLAISGLFMIKGKLGLKWRGSILVTAGIAVPVMYIALSGGPSAKSDKAPAPMPESGIRALPPEPD